jgi:hypothetical protein
MMALFDWIIRKHPPLSRMTRQELRRQELLLQRDRDQLLKRINDLAAKKQEIFDRGRVEKSPEVRRLLAQEFDLKTTEQLMAGRQLNIRSKEALTFTRMRMLRESADRSKSRGMNGGLLGQRDLLALERLIESDAISTEMYEDRLDAMLRTDGNNGEGLLTPGSRQVLDVWEQMDTGLLGDAAQAFDEADRRVRERHQAQTE